MSIAGILNNKGASVIHVAPLETIAGVARILGERNIGAVLVMDGSAKPLGILSERDIVRALARQGAAALDLVASALMTKALWTIAPDADIAEAMRIMTEHRVRHLPVVEDGILVGVVSIGDVVKARLGQQANEVESLRAYVGGMH